MSERTTPALSVAIVVGESRHRAATTLAAITGQERAAEIEVLAVDLCPEEGPIELGATAAEVRFLEAPTGTMFGAARALAERQARAPAIAFVEDHCAPLPGWAAALIEAHADGAAAVGYGFIEAPGGNYAGRSTLLAEYGEWIDPAPGGPTTTLPGNNVSYKRAALLGRDRDGRLERFLAIDPLLQADLVAGGERMVVEPRACVHHESLRTVRESAIANHRYSRLLAAIQVQLGGWGLGRRLAYALAAPLAAPVLRLRRLLRRLGPRRVLLSCNVLLLPGCLAVYVAAALGQSLGYLAGAGRSAEELRRWELAVERR